MNRAWDIFGMAVLAAVISVGIYFILAPKHVVGYSLDSDYSVGVPKIDVDIENGADGVIQLSKDVTWSHAIRMVDSLNDGLKRHPIR